MRYIQKPISIFIIFFSIQYLHSQSSVFIDNSFGLNGIQTTPIHTNYGSQSDIARGMTIQSSGKIILAGSTTTDSTNKIAIVRYNKNGILDSSFDKDGILITKIGSFNDNGYCIANQNDDKILVAGTTQIAPLIHILCIVRYNINGSIDSSYGNNGIIIDNRFERPEQIKLQNDGKLLIVARGGNGSNSKIIIGRFNQNGRADSTFDFDGKLVTSLSNGNDNGLCLAIQSDSKFLIGGSYNNNNTDRGVIIRYNINGSLDSSFEKDGILDCGMIPIRIMVLTNGKTIMINNNLSVKSYNKDGSIDTSFNKTGYYNTSWRPGSGGYSYSTCITTDVRGRILIGGYWTSNNNPGDPYSSNSIKYAMLRLNSNGTIDNSFGNQNNGKITENYVSNNASFTYSIDIQNDGKILMSGSNRSGVYHKFAIARYTNCEKKEVTPPTNSILSQGEVGKFYYTKLNSTSILDSFSSVFSLPLGLTISKDGIISGTPQVSTAQNNQILIQVKSGDCKETFNYTLAVNSKSAITESISKETIKIYPNPAQNILKVDINNNKKLHIEIKIFDIMGRLVNRFISDNSVYEIDVSEYNDGHYFIELNYDNNTIHKCFLKE